MTAPTFDTLHALDVAHQLAHSRRRATRASVNDILVLARGALDLHRIATLAADHLVALEAAGPTLETARGQLIEGLAALGLITIQSDQEPTNGTE